MPQGLYSDTLHRELGFPGGKGLRLKNWVLCVFLWVSNFHNDADSKPTGTQEQRPVGQRQTHGEQRGQWHRCEHRTSAGHAESTDEDAQMTVVVEQMATGSPQ